MVSEVCAQIGHTIFRKECKGGGAMEKGRGEIWRWMLAVAAGMWIAGKVGDSLGIALLPPVAAYLLARLAAPSADAVSHAFHMKRKVGGAVYAVVLCLLIVWFAALLSGKLISELWSLLGELPEYVERTLDLFREISEKLPLDRLTDRLAGEEAGDGFAILSEMISQAAGEAGSMAAGALGSLVQGFPGGILALIVTAIGFIYLTADMDGARESFYSLLPDGVGERLAARIHPVTDAIFAYLRAYLLLLSVTFAELLIGLTVMRVKNALAVALVIAVIDILPVLGCGTVLIPWAVCAFLSGSGARGVGLLILHAVIWLVRQFLEPRVIGKMAGVHPFLALVTTYVGFRLCGIGGMILAPILLAAVAGEVKGNKEEGRGEGHFTS